ncbi:hypothetical protein MIV087L [Invertebrate iridescent virus 3]|uniref:Putative helicase 087L n=1 Tax=Invertebrate iridescent virus 3 TaxID=345201 RepID=VF022_IIV3|nr:hypothetical protein MIV087L [Invertebrate iridescent virus 3]Q196X3.1 RecName: Full=Putative helicase 087L [Invertebrate iridescent virus 3]ABF82117.1 hypothetical protein MIV087L [Invertebrate iridescent virus 3]
MDYNLYDFLPLYHPVQTPAFDRDVNSLSEFTQYELPREEEFPQNPGDLMLHQKLISNFINPHTLYDGVLLVHEMGTGKTCTSVAVAEEFIKNNYSSGETYPYTMVKKIIVLTKGKGLQNNFVNEIANVCTWGQYLEGLDRYIRNRDKKIKKNVKVHYTFDTFEIFAKNLAKMSTNEKRMTYENSLFIVDEAHNLRLHSDPEEGNIYSEIYDLFHLLKSRKILLLTGTPMKDRPEEIIDLFNLILRTPLSVEDLDQPEQFKRKINGHVSYLRAMISDVDRREMGKKLGSLNHFRVQPVVMGDFQSQIYQLAKAKDDEEKSIFNNSRQSSAMVFPDGTYGKQGFEANILPTTSGHKLKPEIRDELRLNLRKYSAKYADLIDRLKVDYTEGRLSFVFSEFVKGSGLVALGLLLELNGYVKATPSSNFAKPQKRYAIFTNETSTDAQTKQLISAFNNPKNLKGEYISTILGSRVIMEGFSFKNIQSEYILSPHWNYSETSQIIARGLRLGSHNDLKKNNIKFEVRIYHYVSLANKNYPAESIDLHMYEIAEEKDLEIQKILRYIKEAAFDCRLNQQRNTITNRKFDGTRNCEYSSCSYECSNQVDIGHDNRNYRLLYFQSADQYEKLKATIIETASRQPFTIEQIVAETKHSEFEVMTVIESLLNYRKVLFTRPEGYYYLSNIKNLFFASNVVFDRDKHYDSNDPTLLNYYTKYTTVYMGKSIGQLIQENQQKYMVFLVKKIFKSKNLVELQKYMVQLPIYLQEKLLSYSISVRHQDIKNNFVRDMVLNNFKLYYKIQDPQAFIWLNPENFLCTANYRDPDQWKPCTPSQQRDIEYMKRDRANIKVSNNSYGFIGLLNRKTNDFCLKKLQGPTLSDEPTDKRKRNVGKRCQNWKKVDLVDLVANKLKVVPDEDFDFTAEDANTVKNNPKFKKLVTPEMDQNDLKRLAFWNAQDVNHLCRTTLTQFTAQKLVVDDPNCGTANKIR